jgi:hypothetical protein
MRRRSRLGWAEKSNSSRRFFDGKAGKAHPSLVALGLHRGDLGAQQLVEEVRVGGLLFLRDLQLAREALRDCVHPQAAQVSADALVGGVCLATHRAARAISA